MKTPLKQSLLIAAVLSLAASASALACEKMKVGGLHCDACKESVEKAFREMPEVETADVDLKSGILSVKYKSGKTLTEQAMKDALKTAGFKGEGCQDVKKKKGT